MKFGTVSYHEHTINIYSNHLFLTKLLNMAMMQILEVMLGQMVNHSVLNFGMSYLSKHLNLCFSVGVFVSHNNF
jgi:hypothetical protein